MPWLLTAACALLLACVILLAVLIGRQRRNEDASARQAETLEEHLRGELARQQQAYTAIAAENSRTADQRVDMLSTRLDVFDQSQDIRLHRIAATLDEKLSANDQRAEQLRPCHRHLRQRPPRI